MSHLATPSRFVGCDVGKTAIVIHDGAYGRTRTIANEPQALANFAASLNPSCFVVCEATGGYERDLLAALIAGSVPAHRADARKSLPSGLTRGSRPSSVRLACAANPTPSTPPRSPDMAGTDTPNSRFGAPANPSDYACRRWSSPDATSSRIASPTPIGAPPPPPSLSTFISRRSSKASRRKSRRSKPISTPSAPRASRSPRPSKPWSRSRASVRKPPPPSSPSCPSSVRSPDARPAALAGLAPHPNQSGQTDAYRRTRGGRPEIKRVLFMAAISAAKHNPTLSAFYKRLLSAGKKPLVAITAIMRKLVLIANAKLRTAKALQVSR